MYKLFFALKNSISGLRFIIRERAFLEELLLFLFTGIPLIYVEISCIKKIYVISSMFIILITETINSAIETTIDRISMEKNHLSKKSKDIASFAVLLSLIHFVIVYSIFVIF